MTLDGSRFLPLAFCSRFFIELTRTQLGEQPGLLDGSLEAPQGNIKRLVFLDSDKWHEKTFLETL